MSRRPLLLALLVVPLVGLSGCAPKPPIGDQQGGVIEWFASTPDQVRSAAQHHCARYGKSGRVVNTESSRAGSQAIFVCE